MDLQADPSSDADVPSSEGLPPVSWWAGMEASLAGELDGLTHDAGAMACAALREARLLTLREGLHRPGMCSVSEDGVLSLQWERVGHGFTVVFSGDGEASFSSRHDEMFYSCIADFRVEDGLPPQARSALDRVLQG